MSHKIAKNLRKILGYHPSQGREYETKHVRMHDGKQLSAGTQSCTGKRRQYQIMKSHVKGGAK